jgi:uncharacterized protein
VWRDSVTIHEIIWLEEIVDKLAQKHRVTMAEVKEVLSSGCYCRFVEKGNLPGEDVYAAFGQTAAGRYLSVFFILKRGSAALVVSARDMSRKERRHYEKA